LCSFSLPPPSSPLPQVIRHLHWHAKGEFLSDVVSDNSSSVLRIHNISVYLSVKSSSKEKMARCPLFYPTKQQFLVAYEKGFRLPPLSSSSASSSSTTLPHSHSAASPCLQM
jgi:hypothetical protein